MGVDWLRVSSLPKIRGFRRLCQHAVSLVSIETLSLLIWLDRSYCVFVRTLNSNNLRSTHPTYFCNDSPGCLL